ncbi:MAG TPA: preprotein translocase subunit SecE [Acidimicrobiia bacterium]|nr:preprotein translocase subunit SecE [Acidimicrobiia bacterium]
MNREMRRLMEREERLQKREKDNGAQRRLPGGPTRGGPPTERKSIWRRLLTFLHEVRLELNKVSWPSREQLIAFTAVTLVVATTLTVVVFGLDVGMKEAIFTLLQQR